MLADPFPQPSLPCEDLKELKTLHLASDLITQPFHVHLAILGHKIILVHLPQPKIDLIHHIVTIPLIAIDLNPHIEITIAATVIRIPATAILVVTIAATAIRIAATAIPLAQLHA